MFAVQFGRHHSMPQFCRRCTRTHINIHIRWHRQVHATFFHFILQWNGGDPLHALYSDCAQSIVCIGIFCFLVVIVSVFVFNLFAQAFKNRRIACVRCVCVCWVPFLLFLVLIFHILLIPSFQTAKHFTVSN